MGKASRGPLHSTSSGRVNTEGSSQSAGDLSQGATLSSHQESQPGERNLLLPQLSLSSSAQERLPSIPVSASSAVRFETPLI